MLLPPIKSAFWMQVSNDLERMKAHQIPFLQRELCMKAAC